MLKRKSVLKGDTLRYSVSAVGFHTINKELIVTGPMTLVENLEEDNLITEGFGNVSTFSIINDEHFRIPKYGFTLDDNIYAFSMIRKDYTDTESARIKFYQEDGTLVDSIDLTTISGIDGLNDTNYGNLLSYVGLTLPTMNNYSTFTGVRFKSRYNVNEMKKEFWAVPKAWPPLPACYTEIRGNNLFVIPYAPWGDGGSKISLKTYLQIGFNAFTELSCAVDTTNLFPIYYSPENKLIYTLYFKNNNSTNTCVLLKLDDEGNIIERVDNGWTMKGLGYRVYWFNDELSIARHLNLDLTYGKTQIIYACAPTVKDYQFFVIEETSSGVLTTNQSKTESLRALMSEWNSNGGDEIYAIPNGLFVTKTFDQTNRYRIQGFHFEGDTVVSDGVLMKPEEGDTTVGNGSPFWIDFENKKIVWGCTQPEDASVCKIQTIPFAHTATLPTFGDSLDNMFKVTLRPVNAYTLGEIDNAYEDIVLPYMTLNGAYATRNMFEYLVPVAGLYWLSFAADQSGNNQYATPDTQSITITDNCIIDVHFTPAPDIPTIKPTGEFKAYRDEEYNTYVNYESSPYLLSRRYDNDSQREYYSVETAISEWAENEDGTATATKTDGTVINLTPEESFNWMKDYLYEISCFDDGTTNYYMINFPNYKRGDTVFTLTPGADSYSIIKTHIATFTADRGNGEPQTAGTAYLNINNELVINGIGTFVRDPNKTAFLMKM